MRLLLDTNALLCWLAGEGLAVQARDAIADPENLVVVSAVSAWEISIKQALGKLTAPDDLEHQVRAGGFVPLPITIAHGIQRGSWPAITTIRSTACSSPRPSRRG